MLRYIASSGIGMTPYRAEFGEMRVGEMVAVPVRHSLCKAMTQCTKVYLARRLSSPIRENTCMPKCCLMCVQCALVNYTSSVNVQVRECKHDAVRAGRLNLTFCSAFSLIEQVLSSNTLAASGLSVLA